MIQIYLSLPRTRNALTTILFVLKVFWFQLGTLKFTWMILLTNRLVNYFFQDHLNLSWGYLNRIEMIWSTPLCKWSWDLCCVLFSFCAASVNCAWLLSSYFLLPFSIFQFAPLAFIPIVAIWALATPTYCLNYFSGSQARLLASSFSLSPLIHPHILQHR